MKVRERVFGETRDLDIGAHWRFQNQNAIWTTMDVDYETFSKEMLVLCNEGYFSAIQDGPATHYIVLKKP